MLDWSKVCMCSMSDTRGHEPSCPVGQESARLARLKLDSCARGSPMGEAWCKTHDAEWGSAKPQCTKGVKE